MLGILIEAVPCRIHTVLTDNGIQFTRKLGMRGLGPSTTPGRQIEAAPQAFLLAGNCACRLSTLKGRTPCELVCRQWRIESDGFRLEPCHHYPGLDTRAGPPL